MCGADGGGSIDGPKLKPDIDPKLEVEYGVLHNDNRGRKFAVPELARAQILENSKLFSVAECRFFFQLSRSMPTANADDPCRFEGT